MSGNRTKEKGYTLEKINENFSGGDIRQGNKKNIKWYAARGLALLNLSRRMDFFFPNRFLLFSGGQGGRDLVGFVLFAFADKKGVCLTYLSNWGSRGWIWIIVN